MHGGSLSYDNIADPVSKIRKKNVAVCSHSHAGSTIWRTTWIPFISANDNTPPVTEYSPTKILYYCVSHHYFSNETAILPANGHNQQSYSVAFDPQYIVQAGAAGYSGY